MRSFVRRRTHAACVTAILVLAAAHARASDVRHRERRDPEEITWFPEARPMPLAITTYTWQGGGGNNNWSNAANWLGGVVPPSSLFNTDLIFGSLAASGASVISSGYNIHALTFDTGAAAYSFSNSPLTIGSGGLTQNAANAQTFTTSQVLVGGNQTWTLASGAGALNFNAGVDTAGSNLTIDAASTAGAGNVINGNFTGSGLLIKNGAGILTLSGTGSTYFGGTTINAGTLAFNNANALGTGTVSLAGGELRATANMTMTQRFEATTGLLSTGTGTVLTLSGAFLVLGDLTVGRAGETGTVKVSASQAGWITNASTLTVAGGTLLAGNFALPSITGGSLSTTVVAGATLDFGSNNATINNLLGSGKVSIGPSLTLLNGDFSGTLDGTGTISKLSSGTLTLSGTTASSSNISSFTLSAGALRLGSNGALGLDAILNLAGGTLSATGGDRIVGNSTNITGNTTIGPSSDGTPRSIVFNRRVHLAAGTTLTVSNDANTTFTSEIEDAGAIVKTGPGTLTLASNTNSFTGGLTLNAGTLALASEQFLNRPDSNVALNAGRLEFLNNVTTARMYNLNSALTLAVSPGKTLTYLSGAGITGGFLGNGGTHAFTNGSALSGATSAVGSTLTSTGNVSFTNATVRGSLTQNSGILTATNTVISSAGSTSVSGTLNANGFESDGVMDIKAGGTVNNSGTALFLGGGSRTTVNSGGMLASTVGIELNGGLLVNNGTQTGVLNVNYGSLAKGAGVFGSVNVNDGGRFSPGNSPGTATFGNLSLGSGGRYEFELNSAHASPGNGADFMNVLGQLDLAGGTSGNSVLTIAIISLNSLNSAAALTDFDASQPYTFALATAAGGITGFSPNEFRVDATGFANNLQGGSFAVAQNGNNLELQFHPVPEPGSVALLLTGLGIAGFRYFRKTRRAHS